jgi:sugar phosphate isomerase/epimerase
MTPTDEMCHQPEGPTMTKFSFILCDPIDSFGNRDSFASVLRTLKEIGYAGVEFNITPGLTDTEGLLRPVEQTQLPIVSFLTGANYFGKGLCLCSPKDEIREQAVEALCGFTRTAAQFGAVLVVGQMQGFRSDEPDRAAAEARIEQALRLVADAAEQNGATVVVEPVNHLQCGFHNTAQSVLDLTRRIGSPNLKPMLDSFHLNIEETSVTEPILRIGKEIGHFHLCESNGGNFGTGHLDVRAILKSLDNVGYRGYVSVKVYREPWEPAARATMEYLSRIEH